MNRAEERYGEKLAALPGMVGRRHGEIMSVAFWGRFAGHDAEDVVADIGANCGTPRMGEKEIRQAVEKVFSRPMTLRRQQWTGRMPKRAAAQTTLRKEAAPKAGSGFVRDMIARGGGEAGSRDLLALSKYGWLEGASGEAVSFLYHLEHSDSQLYFSGAPTDRRTKDRLTSIWELAEGIFADFTPIPTHFMPNDLTGKPTVNEKGEESYAREESLAHKRYALVEFDGLSLREQAAFWVGVITDDMLSVVSLVYTGNKSIHGLLLLEDGQYEEQWQVLEKLLASDAEERYRCDLACRNPGRLTRLPGAINPKTGRRQRLLYLG